MTTHNVVEGCKVFDLGEDGGAWFVAHCDSRVVAEAAVIRHLVECLGDDEEAIGREVTALVAAGSQESGSWWFDDRNDGLRRANVQRRGIEFYSGVAFGIPWVDARPIDLEPLDAGSAS